MDDVQALLEKYERLLEKQLQKQEAEFAERMEVIDDLFTPGSAKDFEGFDEAFTKQLEEFFDSNPNTVSKKDALKGIVDRPPDDEIIGETVVETVSEKVALGVVEIAITKLEPTAEDMVIFWLPENYTLADAQRTGQDLKKVIQNRFRFAVFVKDTVSLSVIKGSSSKILLPS